MNITKILINWYSVNKRVLPWRKTKNPYHIWLSEIILQQTQIKQGLPYYEAFISKYPNVLSLANAPESEVLKLWQGLGYYSRARNLHASAKYIVNDLNQEFPDTYKTLLKLKGVGDYTASAIASICFNEPAAVVDGNVYRVLSRFYGIDTPINSSKGIKLFKALAQDIIDENNPGDYNQAIMEFGAVQCKPANPDCNICPLTQDCVAYRNNNVQELPVKIKAKKPQKKFFNFLVFISDSETTVLEKRKGKGIWENLYQFPLLESDKSLTEKSIKETLKDYKLTKNSSYKLTLFNQDEIIHKLSHQHLYAKFWILNVSELPQTVTPVPISKINDYAVPVLIGNFIEAFNF
ncbi:A/G-specific adenine glycosylase [Corallibacter sp.]|uniref:A/G-specific adenine glycosylase n=1 Tax=Corallibacter sp. TaxID=2038084 RepID=UPI003A8F8938